MPGYIISMEQKYRRLLALRPRTDRKNHQKEEDQEEKRHSKGSVGDSLPKFHGNPKHWSQDTHLLAAGGIRCTQEEDFGLAHTDLLQGTMVPAF